MLRNFGIWLVEALAIAFFLLILFLFGAGWLFFTLVGYM